MTFGERYAPALRAMGQVEADRCFGDLVAALLAGGEVSRHHAEMVVRRNLGYYAGYFSSETFERLLRLYRTRHPVFGVRLPELPGAGGGPRSPRLAVDLVDDEVDLEGYLCRGMPAAKGGG